MTNKTRTCSITENSAILQEMLALPVRETLADYFELSPNVSRGGMGTVYFCRDKRDKQFYALKTYQTTDPKFKDLFLKEAEFALGLEKHPNIVYTRTVAMEGYTYYMVMDLVSLHQPQSITDEVKGNTLAQELAHKIPLEQALKWAIDLCHGMEYLNSKGMVAHGDLKPSNLFITSDKVLKVGDFGTVVLKGEKQKGGTLKYSSPEFEKKQKVDVRSDIYSFGIILYEMLNGGLNLLYPTRVGDKDKKYYQRLSRKFIKKSQCAALIAKCLEQDPKKRYANFAELRADLETLIAFSKNSRAPRNFLKSFTSYEYVLKGQGWAIFKEYEKVVDLCTKAVKLDVNYAFAYNNRGIALKNLQCYEEAIADYTKAIKFEPTYVFAYINRGNVLQILGRYQEALSDYTKAIKLDPKSAYGYYHCGIVLYALQHYKEAIENYSKAIACDPKFTLAYYNRGFVLAGLNHYKEAIHDYTVAIELDPQNVNIYGNRGNAFVVLGYYEKAIEDYTNAIELMPNLSAAYCGRGVAFYHLKCYDKVIADYTKAISCDNKYVLAYNNRGEMYMELKQYIQAEKDFQKVLSLEKNNQDALMGLLKIYYTTNHPKKAAQIQKQLDKLKEKPNTITVKHKKNTKYLDF